MKSQAERVSRQLRGWAESLQNSEIKGQRYLTDKVRREVQQKKERDEFDAYLKEILEKATAERLAKQEAERIRKQENS